MKNEEKFLLQCALADLQGALQAHEAMDRLAHDWVTHAQTIAEIEDALRDVDYAESVEKALRDIIKCWEQGGTPMEIDAAMNRAAGTLEKEV